MYSPIADLPLTELRQALLHGSNKAVAARYGVAVITIWKWRHRLFPTARATRHQTPRRALLLATLAAHPEGLRLCDLVRLHGTTRQNLHDALRRAHCQGLVAREADRWRLAQSRLTQEG